MILSTFENNNKSANVCKIAGEYEIHLNGNSLASGVYFIILRTTEHIYGHKILILN